MCRCVCAFVEGRAILRIMLACVSRVCVMQGGAKWYPGVIGKITTEPTGLGGGGCSSYYVEYSDGDKEHGV